MISLFTPFYNRAQYLDRVYESLEKQTNKNFEWIIIDDGSTDNTDKKVELIKKKATFPIKYVYQVNQGKPTAFNRGVEMATGEYFFAFDSDDWLYEDAIDVISQKIQEIKDINGFCPALVFQCTLASKIPLTRMFPGNPWKAGIFQMVFIEKILGDTAIIFETSKIKNVLFPKFAGEKFIPEALVLHRFEKQYDYYFYNTPVKYVEYQEDGLSANMFNLFISNPQAYYQYCLELLNFFNVPLYQRIRHIAAVGTFSTLTNRKSKETIRRLEKKIDKFAYIFLIPLTHVYAKYLKITLRGKHG